jgi:hypothetical protein
MRTILLTAACLVVAATTQAPAFQLSCAHQGGIRTVTINGKTEMRRTDYPYSTVVDVNLAAKTFMMEGGSGGDIITANAVEIVAGERWTLGGTTHRNTWQLNRVTGELTWDEEFTGNSPSTHHSVFHCELVKPKF